MKVRKTGKYIKQRRGVARRTETALLKTRKVTEMSLDDPRSRIS